MAAARYVLHIPAQDELRRPLRLHEAVHAHLEGLGAQPVQSTPGVPYYQVSGWAEDTPEWDSMAKQAGTQAAELANVPVIHVTKEGAKPAAWQMSNPQYLGGYGAHDSALAPSLITSIHSSLKNQFR